MALLINGQRISDAVLTAEFSEIKGYFERLGNVSCCERDEEFRGYARTNVIARVLLAQEAARRFGPAADAEVDAAVAQLIQRYGGEMQFFAATGASPTQMHLVRHDVDADLRVKRMMDELTADLRPAEPELRSFHEKNIDQFMSPEEVRASHILKSPRRGEDRDPAYQALRKARRELMGGADFDAIARRESEKAAESIDLGFFKRGELTEEFELVAFSMDVGEISPIFTSPFGFHLIKLTDRKPAAPRPFEEVRDLAREGCIEQHRQERARNLVDELKTRAVIEEVEETEAEMVGM